ncbi:kinase-like domain-containing protein [Rhizophagus clarus]|uniref:Kinase-like domain-containing protein n=2 Tax=Rhizophagus clarus TaxID=94130 RepID=A0A8H3LW89_9GLOM|nr:kinase-like domain-containing protein [Rhizophagus clarus]
MKVPRKNKISSSVVYTKPTKEQKEYYKQKSVVENTHLSTNNWLKKFEKYRKTIGLAEITDEDVYIYQVSLLKELNFTDIEVMSVSRHKSISGLKSYERSSEKLQNVSLNGLVEAIFMPDQNTLTSCSTTSMIINEQNNDNQNIDITPDTISTPGFRSALQVAKENISLQQVSVNNDKKMKEPLQEDENDKNISNSNVDIERLKIMHESNLVHRDLHDGNILISDNYETYIIDLGLCRLVEDLSQDKTNKNYGVLPFMAPEVLRNKSYIPASDIYSFSMIMWEFTSGIPPFHNEIHDHQLALSICKGKRPEIIKNTPKCYIDLMEKCWNSDPSKRPTVEMVEHIISQWLRCINEFYYDENSFTANTIQFKNDIDEFAKANKALSQEQTDTPPRQFYLEAYNANRQMAENLANSEISDCKINSIESKNLQSSLAISLNEEFAKADKSLSQEQTDNPPIQFHSDNKILYQSSESLGCKIESSTFTSLNDE